MRPLDFALTQRQMGRLQLGGGWREALDQVSANSLSLVCEDRTPEGQGQGQEQGGQ